MKTPPIVAPVTLTNIKIQTLTDLGERVSSLQATLPQNRDGLPLAYIDPQILAESGFLEGSISKERVEKSVVQISYSDGYAVVNNLPFWERIDGELLDYYELFKTYRDMRYIQGQRSMLKVADSINIPIQRIIALAKTYHWVLRARAFDYYKELEALAVREQSIKEMEGRHSKTARKLFDRCMELITTEGMEELMNPKTILEWFQTAIKLERMSRGLDPDKVITTEDTKNITNIIQNIQSDNRKLNINVKGMQDILDVLAGVGALDSMLAKEIIDVAPEEDNGKNNSSGDGGRAAVQTAAGSHSQTK